MEASSVNNKCSATWSICTNGDMDNTKGTYVILLVLYSMGCTKTLKQDHACCVPDTTMNMWDCDSVSQEKV